MILTVRYIAADANVATILGFIALMVGAILAPLYGSRRTVRKMGEANGALKNHPVVKPEQFEHYNLYDLCLESLVNSKTALDNSAAAAEIAGMARAELRKLVEHLGIEE